MKVRKTDSCWEWTGAKHGCGYGAIKRGGGGRNQLASHRASWEIHFGPVPQNMQVLHHCDNRGCVNPLHLFLGTQSDNVRDAMRKGKFGITALSPDEVRAIRASPLSRQELADTYGVGWTQIWYIQTGRSWTWLQ